MDDGHADIGEPRENGTSDTNGTNNINGAAGSNPAYGGHASATEQAAAIAAGLPAVKGAAVIPRSSDDAPYASLYLLVLLAAAAFTTLALQKKAQPQQALTQETLV